MRSYLYNHSSHVQYGTGNNYSLISDKAEEELCIVLSLFLLCEIKHFSILFFLLFNLLLFNLNVSTVILYILFMLNPEYIHLLSYLIFQLTLLVLVNSSGRHVLVLCFYEVF